MNVYQKIMIYSQNLFAQFLQQRDNRNNFARATNDEQQQFAKLHQQVSKIHGASSDVVSGHHILILILRLRQICIHPSLIHSVSSLNFLHSPTLRHLIGRFLIDAI